MYVIKELQKRLFPNDYQIMVKKWNEDGGDQALRFNYDLDEKSLVIDLGGYQGQWASDLFSRFQCHIYVFEPVPEFAENIQKRFKLNNNIEIFNFGLGGSTRSENIHILGDSSSVFGKSDYCQTIKIVDIVDWLTDKKIRTITLLKINIEGGEYELLERLINSKFIDIFENIQVQFHNITSESHLRMKKIQQELRKTHFPNYQYNFVWEDWRRIK